MNAPDQPLRGQAGRLLGTLAGVAALFAIALVALLCYKSELMPWELSWTDGWRPSNPLLASLHEARHEIAALALAALNLAWLMLRRGNSSGRPSEAPEPPSGGPLELGTSLDVEALLVGGSPGSASEPDAPVGTSSVVPTSSLVPGGTKSDVQLGIAVAELARLRRELAACRVQLDAANAVKSQFLANMSHELRTPMNGIMGMTDLLLGGELPARERRFAESIAASSNSLLGVISDLLDFSRIESGTLYLERSRFRVRDAVEDVCAVLAGGAHAKGIELVCYVDENVPTLADGDATRLRQVLDNLVRNAIAFTDEGEVVVRMTRVEEHGARSLYRCDVQDTGCGISPELQMTMFDAFTQADNSHTRRHGGLGMGLTITRELVTMMGGTVTLKSRLGEGTRFGFTVMLDNVDDAIDEETMHRPIRGARVLVVDDNETNRTILYHQLSGWGIVTDTADCGEIALARLKDAAASGVRYDMLVLDLHMPGMDGVELARRIQADPALAGIRSLMLTSALLDLDTDELAALGIDRYISKPPRQSVLHDSLVSLLPSSGLHAPESSPARSIAPISARVLLAEDNLVSQDVGVAMLESVGCQVDVAGDGREALVQAGEMRYDLILMDCRMPLMDGYAATSALREGDGPNAGTPIVALTANAMAGDRERCLEAGMDDYLAKPVRSDDLHILLTRWVALAAPEPSTSASGAAGLAKSARSDESAVPSPSVPVDEVSAPMPAATAPAPGDPGTDNGSERSSDAPPLVNPVAIEAIRSLQRPGKPDLLGKVLGVYFDKTPGIVAAMREALVTADVHALKEQAHSLKSSSAYVGAEGLSEKCRRIERAAAKGDLDKMTLLVEAIGEEFEAVARELGALRKAA